ncbi:unnamed protein product, partial [Tenebrio molitor]
NGTETSGTAVWVVLHNRSVVPRWTKADKRELFRVANTLLFRLVRVRLPVEVLHQNHNGLFSEGVVDNSRNSQSIVLSILSPYFTMSVHIHDGFGPLQITHWCFLVFVIHGNVGVE